MQKNIFSQHDLFDYYQKTIIVFVLIYTVSAYGSYAGLNDRTNFIDLRQTKLMSSLNLLFGFPSFPPMLYSM